MNKITFRHSGSAGDCIASIPCIQELSEKYNAEPILYLQSGVPANYYKGAIHPCGDVRMNVKMVNALLPLMNQCFETHHWKNEAIDVHLDLFRATGFPQHMGYIPSWYNYAFDYYYDYSKPWLYVTPYEGIGDKIVVARTSRYRNRTLNYSILNKYQPLFIGLESEWADFQKSCPDAGWMPTNDFLEVAQIIKGCKAFISNQTAAWMIAEAMKVKRMVEVCWEAPNVSPHGPNGYEAFSQSQLIANLERIMQ